MVSLRVGRGKGRQNRSSPGEMLSLLLVGHLVHLIGDGLEPRLDGFDLRGERG